MTFQVWCAQVSAGGTSVISILSSTLAARWLEAGSQLWGPTFSEWGHSHPGPLGTTTPKPANIPEIVAQGSDPSTLKPRNP